MEGKSLHLNIVVGASGVIGKVVSDRLAINDDMSNILVDSKTVPTRDIHFLDLTEFDAVSDFIDKIEFSDRFEAINIVFLAAKDKKLG